MGAGGRAGERIRGAAKGREGHQHAHARDPPPSLPPLFAPCAPAPQNPHPSDPPPLRPRLALAPSAAEAAMAVAMATASSSPVVGSSMMSILRQMGQVQWCDIHRSTQGCAEQGGERGAPRGGEGEGAGWRV